jgi:hypothetical protein
MERVLFGSATVGDCRGLWTGCTAASNGEVIIGGNSGVEDKALRSNGSPTLSRSNSSVGETGMLLLALIDMAGVGGISFWSKPGKEELVMDEERLEGGLARLVVCIPNPAGTMAFLRFVNLLVKEFRRIDKVLSVVVSIDR